MLKTNLVNNVYIKYYFEHILLIGRVACFKQSFLSWSLSIELVGEITLPVSSHSLIRTIFNEKLRNLKNEKRRNERVPEKLKISRLTGFVQTTESSEAKKAEMKQIRKENEERTRFYRTTIKAASKNTLTFIMSGDTWQKRNDSNTSPPLKGHEIWTVGSLEKWRSSPYIPSRSRL